MVPFNPSIKRNWTMQQLRDFNPKPKRYNILSDRYPGLKLTVYPTGRKVWVVDYRNPQGDRKTYTIGTLDKWSHSDAAKEASSLFAKSRDPHQDKIDVREQARLDRIKKGTVADLLSDQGDYWLLRLKDTTRGTDSRRRIQSTFPELMDIPLADITPLMLERHQSRRKAAGRAPASIMRERSMLSTVLEFAVRQGMIPENPYKNVPRLKLDMNTAPRYLDKEKEWPRMLAALNDPRTSKHIADLVKMALGTGMRRGELFKLQWENINLDAHQLTVVGTSAKTGTTRHIPLNDSVLSVLQSRAKEFGDKTPTGLVFPNEHGSQLTTIKTGFTALLRRARIKGFRFHDCRHTFASWLVQSGVPLNTVRELLGHSSMTMTLRYSHLAPENKSSAVQLIDLG